MLIVRALNQLYVTGLKLYLGGWVAQSLCNVSFVMSTEDLKLTVHGEMDIAYRGEAIGRGWQLWPMFWRAV